jgi:hypothetical protein
MLRLLGIVVHENMANPQSEMFNNMDLRYAGATLLEYVT